MKKICPCGSGLPYSDCCEPYINNQQPAASAEALMRSRYSAYSQADTDYIARTMRGKAATGFDPLDAKRWASQVTWLGLNVLHHQTLSNKQAYVTFAARFKDAQGIQFIHEKSLFEKDQDQWFYIDGDSQPLPTRNQSCLCGSGKKFKRCCG